MYDGVSFEPGEAWPDGTAPYEAMALFSPWVEVAKTLMDGDGAWIAFPWGMVLMDQPEFDMTVLTIIRGRWSELRKRDMKRGSGH